MVADLTQPPIWRLWDPPVYFDTQIPRYFAAINECELLRAAFPRARITTGVRLELEHARPYVRQAGGDLGGLLDDPCWAEVEEITDPKEILQVVALRCAGAGRNDRLVGTTKDLGEAEVIVKAQKNRLPIIIEDGRGARAARGRGLAAYRVIHACMIIALRRLRTPEDSWELYGALLAAGLKQRDQSQVAFDRPTREDYLAITEAGLIRGHR